MSYSADDIFKWYARQQARKYIKIIIALIVIGLLIFFGIMSTLQFFAAGYISSKDTKIGFASGQPTSLAMATIGEYLEIFEQAQKKYNVSWAVLAAICKIETDFGKNIGVSSAGAVGFMQFMPTTWSGCKNPKASNNPDNPSWDTDPETIARYGGYGVDADGDGKADPFNPWDAVFAAAKYLAANGFMENPRKAIYAYNHADWYVNKVMETASSFSEQMIPLMEGMWMLPANYTQISCYYGAPRDNSFHHGVDIVCPVGTPVSAIISGKVTVAKWKGVYGNAVMIDGGNGVQILYGHLSKINVKEGEIVEQGQVIALSGNTGKSTGPHLHFEVRINGTTCDPLQWIQIPSQNY